MSDCDHGYVVRAALNENRFLCKECNERFVRHPDIMRKKAELDQAIAQELEEEKQRGIAAGWEPRTYQENAKKLVEALLGNNGKS